LIQAGFQRHIGAPGSAKIDRWRARRDVISPSLSNQCVASGTSSNGTGYLAEVGRLETPLLMHLADEDEFISKAAQTEIKAALASNPNAIVYILNTPEQDSDAAFCMAPPSLANAEARFNRPLAP
jgi:dienelactone hydrolase